MSLYSTPHNLNSVKTSPDAAEKYGHMLRTSLNRTPGKQPMGGFHPAQMMGYPGPMMYPPYFGMHPSYMMGMGYGNAPPEDVPSTSVTPTKKSADPKQYLLVSYLFIISLCS